MSTDLAAVHKFSSGEDTIHLSTPKPNADIWEVRTFRTNNAHAKLLDGKQNAAGQPERDERLIEVAYKMPDPNQI
jgi:hypothetical protein